MGQRATPASVSWSGKRSVRRNRRGSLQRRPVHLVGALAQPAARNIGWRLDYMLARKWLFDRVVSCKVLTEVGTSDHAPVMAAFSL